MVKLIIFDLDGTLIDAYRAIEESTNFTLTKLGYPPVTSETVRRSIGMGDKNFIRRFVRRGDVGRALAIYRRHHRHALCRYAKSVPGARMLLTRLRRQHYRLAVASNRPRVFSLLLLSHLRLRQYFDVIKCAASKRDIKPKPHLLNAIMRRLKATPAETIFVGDMVIDVHAGRNAGIRTVAMRGGSSTMRELKHARPYAIITHPAALVPVLARAA